mmetsp:Transcript_3025/g.6408  ORF Transcript_3025/g.6408 Transcript_3025/m.6408 type:complete len:101 (+) Transcript_3025:1590-1892(+)
MDAWTWSVREASKSIFSLLPISDCMRHVMETLTSNSWNGRLGLDEGRSEGASDGLSEGSCEGVTEGVLEGLRDGLAEGIVDGLLETVGNWVGVDDGTTEG